MAERNLQLVKLEWTRSGDGSYVSGCYRIVKLNGWWRLLVNGQMTRWTSLLASPMEYRKLRDAKGHACLLETQRAVNARWIEPEDKHITIGELKPGDKFDWPDSWHGPSVVESIEPNGRSRRGHPLVRLVFANPKIINPPGTWIGSPGVEVVLVSDG